MRWGDFRRSDNVEDRTRREPGRRRLRWAAASRLGGGALIVIVIVSLLFGVNPLEMLGMLERRPGAPPRRSRSRPGLRPAATRRPGRPRPAGGDGSDEGLRRARAGRHRGRVERGVQGDGRALRAAEARAVPARHAVGVRTRPRPSARSTVRPTAGLYLDTAFFDELSRRFGAPGDFAQAYVIAHEVGHHVQNLIGHDAEVRPADAAPGRSAAATRCRCASSCRPTATPACGATSRRSATCSRPATSRRACAPRPPSATTRSRSATQGYVVPESFTHGTAEQRMRWFRAGLETGDPRNCNTFAARAP